MQGPAEIGRAASRRKARSDYCAWLYAVARKDLPAGEWRIDEGMGEGAMSADLVFPLR
jgi:hypothetical protein